MISKIYIGCLFLIPFGLFSQTDTSKNIIGIEIGQNAHDYSAFFQRTKGKISYQFKGGYTSGNYYQINRGDGSSQTLDALNKVIGLGFFQGNGYNLGAAFDYRLSSKKNHFYYRLGLTFRNVYVDKISYTDSPNVDVSESTFAYAFKSKNIDLSLLNGFGYSLSVSRINIKAFAAIEIKKMYFNGEYLYLHTYNFQTSQHIDHDPSTLSDFKKGDWYFLPTINVSVGYSL